MALPQTTNTDYNYTALIHIKQTLATLTNKTMFQIKPFYMSLLHI